MLAPDACCAFVPALPLSLLLQEIRALGFQVPIVAMTANASDRDRQECIAAGMDGFLSKPVLKDQLTLAIREAILCRRSLSQDGSRRGSGGR